MQKLKEVLKALLLVVFAGALIVSAVTIYINVVSFKVVCNGRSDARLHFPFGYQCWFYQEAK